MTAKRPSFAQIAYIVRSGGLDAAIDHWVTVMGAGPFFVGVFPLLEQRYQGQPTDQQAIVAIGYLGDVQIELIEPTNQAAGPYGEWVRRHPAPPVGGVYHHFMVDEGDYEATIARLTAGGLKPAFTAKSPQGDRVAYLEAFESTGGYVEVIDSPMWPAVCSELLAISRDWDGADPRRSFDTLSVPAGAVG